LCQAGSLEADRLTDGLVTKPLGVEAPGFAADLGEQRAELDARRRIDCGVEDMTDLGFRAAAMASGPDLERLMRLVGQLADGD